MTTPSDAGQARTIGNAIDALEDLIHLAEANPTEEMEAYGELADGELDETLERARNVVKDLEAWQATMPDDG